MGNIFKDTNRRRNLRHALYRKQDRKCALCDGILAPPDNYENHDLTATLDHIIPRSKGGTDRVKNLQLAHRRCNEDRGDDD